MSCEKGSVSTFASSSTSSSKLSRCNSRKDGIPSRSQLKIFPTPAIEQHLPYPSHDWYSWWMLRQIERQPQTLFTALHARGNELGSDGWLEVFVAAWREVWVEARHPSASIDSIIQNLERKELLVHCDDGTTLDYARYLILSIIGWQTMLYRTDMGSCCGREIAIADETNGYRGIAHMCLRQDRSACSRPLCDFLQGFGVMLPCRNFNAFPSDEDQQAFKKISHFAPNTFNAELLSKVGRVRFQWTDSLACHLELDRDSNTLYLFRYPSFCILHLASADTRSTLHACAAPITKGSYWANVDEINDLLREILLSYRLLFGQHKQSRKLFRKESPFHGAPQQGHDEILSSLCGRKVCPQEYELREREVYDARYEFPILGSRLAVVSNHLANIRPRTWRELWNDKRDSATWYTFWAVLIIGGLGLVLGFIQTVLQLTQTVIAIQQA